MSGNTGEHASVYWWKDWDVTTNQQGMKRRLVTYHGIRFHDEGKEGEIVYIPMLVNSVLLKDKKPGLKEFSKNWFKGKEGKARKKRPMRTVTARGCWICMRLIWRSRPSEG